MCLSKKEKKEYSEVEKLAFSIVENLKDFQIKVIYDKPIAAEIVMILICEPSPSFIIVNSHIVITAGTVYYYTQDEIPEYIVSYL